MPDSELYRRVAERLRETRSWEQLERWSLDREKNIVQLHGAHGSLRSMLLASLLAERRNGRTLVVTPTDQEATRFARDLQTCGVTAEVLPWWGTVPYRPTPVHSRTFGDRASVLAGFAGNSGGVLVASERAVLTPVPAERSFREGVLVLHRLQEFDPQDAARSLVELGYQRVSRATVTGEFALRGEVLDLVPPGQDAGVRVVFNFDRIEAIRYLDAETQVSQGLLDSVSVPPLREVRWTPADRDRLRTVMESRPDLQRRAEEISEELSSTDHFTGEEWFYPLAAEGAGSIAAWLGGKDLLVLVDRERLESGAQALRREYDALYRRVRTDLLIPSPADVLLEFDSLTSERAQRLEMLQLQTDSALHSVDLGADPPRSFFGNVNFLKEEFANQVAAGTEIVLVASSEAQAHRLRHLIPDLELEVLTEDFADGFGIPESRLLVVHESEIFGRRRRAPRSVSSARSEMISSFVDLSPGDYIVHLNYGIGRYQGIRRMQVGGNERDYVHLEFAGEEFIYLPIEQVNLIQRYIGSHGEAPRLDTIGGSSWERRKSRVRKSVEDLADSLIELYSRRRQARGFAFGPDTEWQLEFEARFPFEETPDQLRCIAEVKADMEAPVPMDRLVCGDVGFGKTEVAIRAAFKAVTAGKQVAFLAPTTILAEQHFNTISDRVSGYPVRVGMLSRFVPPAEARKVISGAADGSVDILVGTHRILQKDMKFHDLGLVVVDEEQRFGVKDKERLKELRTTVDYLTMTATPIPRTLHMSMVSIRDMSLLTTAPMNRRPIETVIREFDEDLVAEAIRAEVRRGGQVYYLHNRVNSLDQVRLFIQRLVPEAFVEQAHGQMSANQLEDIMRRFVDGAVQVLVSTTIVENGIDIPNVNTIIIDRADMYGIAQLYQLRGRVGRSERLAYAYLLYPERVALSEAAMKRLQVINDYTDLGSGFKVALKDLEVRGAGNLLGREQSGDIMAVGFDLYVKLLDEAIRRRKDERAEEILEPYLELQYEGFIPDGYVDDVTEKMEVYKKIASVGDQEDLLEVSGLLEDRYGPIPEEVQSLLSLAEIRILCRRLGLASIREKQGRIELEFTKVSSLPLDRVMTLIRTSGGTVRPDPQKPNVLRMEAPAIGLREKSEFLRDRLSVLAPAG